MALPDFRPLSEPLVITSAMPDRAKIACRAADMQLQVHPAVIGRSSAVPATAFSFVSFTW